ncbi:MAG: tripartite tricarboxylate transporter TctB family protein [Succinivibrionaceae bacterium]|nr:tripartite tricarboxylate transporter TctB family protein [Succinivibrionaceae bacterium]
MTHMQICNFVIAAITALVGGMIAMTSWGYGVGMTMFGPGAGFWPFILGLMLLLVAALIVYDSLAHAAEYRAQQVVFTAPSDLGVYRLMALVVLYAALMGFIGFYLATCLFIPAMMYLIGSRRPGVMAATTLIFLAVVYLLFTKLLHLMLPLPWFMD